MSPAVPRRVIVWFGLGCAVLAVNAAIAYQTIASLREATRSVEDGLRVAELLRSVRSAVADSEAGQRGYIISEKKEYLELSSKALRVADGQLTEIRALIGPDAVDLEKVTSLQSSIAARAAEFDQTLELLTKADRPAALKAISTIIASLGNRLYDAGQQVPRREPEVRGRGEGRPQADRQPRRPSAQVRDAALRPAEAEGPVRP